MKAIWQGTLSFGLVNIPVSLYSAVEAQALGFTMLCATCNNPITYKRWCNHCEKEVEWSNIVKGLKIKKDTYFVLTQENLHKLKPTKTDAINIVEFVDPSLIDPIYLEKHYYLAPKRKVKTHFINPTIITAVIHSDNSNGVEKRLTKLCDHSSSKKLKLTSN